MNHTSTRKLDTFECYNYDVLGDIQIDLARSGVFPGGSIQGAVMWGARFSRGIVSVLVVWGTFLFTTPKILKTHPAGISYLSYVSPTLDGLSRFRLRRGEDLC